MCDSPVIEGVVREPFRVQGHPNGGRLDERRAAAAAAGQPHSPLEAARAEINPVAQETHACFFIDITAAEALGDHFETRIAAWSCRGAVLHVDDFAPSIGSDFGVEHKLHAAARLQALKARPLAAGADVRDVPYGTLEIESRTHRRPTYHIHPSGICIAPR